MKEVERETARSLRSQGWSVKAIEKELGVSRSSVSRWVGDVVLSDDQIKVLNRNQEVTRRYGNKAVQEHAKRRHEADRDAGRSRASTDSSFRVLCALYWGEGNKTGKIFAISNADPSLLNTAVRWFEKEGRAQDLQLEVYHYETEGVGESSVREWWLSQLPGLSPNQLTKVRRCKISRASQKKNIGKQPFGTGRLYLKKSTSFFFHVMGGIDWLRQEGG